MTILLIIVCVLLAIIAVTRICDALFLMVCFVLQQAHHLGAAEQLIRFGLLPR